MLRRDKNLKSLASKMAFDPLLFWPSNLNSNWKFYIFTHVKTYLSFTIFYYVKFRSFSSLQLNRVFLRRPVRIVYIGDNAWNRRLKKS